MREAVFLERNLFLSSFFSSRHTVPENVCFIAPSSPHRQLFENL